MRVTVQLGSERAGASAAAAAPTTGARPTTITPGTPRQKYKRIIRRVIAAYDSALIRAYSRVRFTIINVNILHILSLCLRGKRRILDVGCGFGLFGCYLASAYPDIEYHGMDLDERRIGMARQAAQRLGLRNATFTCADARSLSLNDHYDAIMMVHLLHHIDDSAKLALLSTCAAHLNAAGRLLVKDVTNKPFPNIAFTWLLDVLMTAGFDMWYWSDVRFESTLRQRRAAGSVRVPVFRLT